MILEICIFLITTLIIYFWYTYKLVEKHFESRNVKYLPGWPIFGNAWKTMLKKHHVFHDMDQVYRAFPNERYVGYIDGAQPTYLIRDPDLIKQITVKDFEHFTDHKDFISENVDPLFGGSLFMMNGEKWRDMRTILSPAFTGSKMKHMMPFMVDISKNILTYLKEHSNGNVDVDELIRRYTNDVIASTSFGLEVNSFKDRDNEFFKMGQYVLNFDIQKVMVVMLNETFPYLVKKLGLKMYSKKTYAFFNDAIMNTVRYRKTNNVSRPDMIQLLMETKDWTPNELCAQAFIFFIAGFETAASSLVLAIHELALNPDVQEKLYQEIRAFKEAGHEITCDSLNSMKYLDCVLNETLRKWSPSVILDRKCTKTYELPPPSKGGKPVTLNPGDVVYNSANSLHLDPQYWPNPLKFDPDRWSDENKHKIKPFTYQPFGQGPRICIGSRFAILETKILLYYLVLNFKILKTEKTSDPINLINFGFNIKSIDGTWAKFEERT